MEATKEAFINLIGRIVHEQMNEDQQTQFDIDGKEIIETIFQPAPIREKDDLKTTSTFGISHAALDAFNAATGFGSLVASCLALYIEFKSKKKKPLKDRVNKLEFLEQLKERLSKQDMDSKLIKAIDEKYGDELIDILDNL
jgi:hypothetical protein